MQKHPPRLFSIALILTAGLLCAPGFDARAQGVVLDQSVTALPNGFFANTATVSRHGGGQDFKGKMGWNGTIGGISSEIGASYSFSAEEGSGKSSIKPHVQLSRDFFSGGGSQRLFMRFDSTMPTAGKEVKVETTAGIREVRFVSESVSFAQEVAAHATADSVRGVTYHAMVGWHLHEGVHLSLPRVRVWVPLDGNSEPFLSVGGRVQLKF